MTIIIRGEPSRLGNTTQLATPQLVAAVGRNPGNLAFSYATALLLGFPPSRPIFGEIGPEESVGIFTFANVFGKHFSPNSFLRFLSSANPKWRMLCIGMGAQGPFNNLKLDVDDVVLTDQHIEWVHSIQKHSNPDSPNMSLRGKYTQAVLEKYNISQNTVVTGCPSLLISPEKRLGEIIMSKFDSISDTPVIDGNLGTPWDSLHFNFERRLYYLARSTGGSITVQMSDKHLALARGDKLSDEDLTCIRNQLSPDKPIADFWQESRRVLKVWWDVPGWMEHCRKVDFVFGTRIHGATLAIQSGTPALCVAWDSRTLELCEEMMIPYVKITDEPWLSGNFTWEDLKSAFITHFDPKRFDENRQKKAAVFEQLFTSYGVPVSKQLRELALPISPNQCE